MSRLVLVDTSDALPGLLPLHSWSALMSSELVLVASDDHPFLPHLEVAELAVEVVPDPAARPALTRGDLLGGLDPAQKGRAEWIVERVKATGEVTYLFGAADTEAFTRTLGMEAARQHVEVEIVYFMAAPKGARLLDLVRVEERLRGPGGCPWDREQDHASLARYAVEEVYELLEAIGSGDPTAIAEELGDVLLQVVFHAQIAQDRGAFTIDDVAEGIADKLVRRHPHVFGDAVAEDATAVMARWEELKAAEKPERTGPFDGVTVAQPAVQYAEQLLSRAAKQGFDWPAQTDAAAQVREELDEVEGAGDDGREDEIGDVLLAVVGLARRAGVDPETALRGAARRFRTRFERAAGGAGTALDELSAERWLALWADAKGAAEDA